MPRAMHSGLAFVLWTASCNHRILATPFPERSNGELRFGSRLFEVGADRIARVIERAINLLFKTR